MATKIGKAPSWWTGHKKKIWFELQEFVQRQQQEFDNKNVSKEWTWFKQQKRKQRTEFAKLYQYTNSSAELMHKHQDRVSFMLTFTILCSKRTRLQS